MLDSPLDGIRSPFGVRRGRAFSPSTLFALAEPGVWFDLSDLTTLFADPAGTTPVTAPGNTVGLMLDKSRGLALGAELVTNGDFSGGGTGWLVTGAVTFSGGVAVFGSGVGFLAQNGILQIGKTYRVTFTLVTSAAGNDAKFHSSQWLPEVALSAAPISNGPGTYTLTLRAVTANFRLDNYSGSGFQIDNISVRELAGNHATQATLVARPTYSIEPVGGRRNLLTYSEGFAAAPWVRPNITATAAAAVAPDGTMTATKLTSFAGFGNQGVFIQSAAFTWNGQTGSFYVKAGTTSIVSVCSVVNQVRAYYDIGNETVGNTLNCTASITPVGDEGWYRCECRSSSTGSGGYYAIVIEEALRAVNPWDNYTGTGKDLYIWGAQLELGSTATAYQRVTTQYDVTEAGVASLGYLYFDGVNDAMVTSTITPGIDKAQVFTGLQKLNDTPSRVLVEYSPTVNTSPGSFGIFAPSTGSYTGSLNGSAQSVTNIAGFPAPITNVISALYDIAGATIAEESIYRINGVVPAQTNNGVPAGTGSFGNYSLNIGYRPAAGLYLWGHLYSLITRFGPNLTTARISATESWVASKTAGATL